MRIKSLWHFSQIIAVSTQYFLETSAEVLNLGNAGSVFVSLSQDEYKKASYRNCKMPFSQKPKLIPDYGIVQAFVGVVHCSFSKAVITWRICRPKPIVQP